MSALLAAVLAGAAAAVLVGLPSPARLRFRQVTAARNPRRPASPSALAVAAGVGIAVLWVVLWVGPVAALVLVLAGLLAVRWDGRRRSRCCAAEERAGMLEACAVLAGELAAGRAPAAALAAAAELARGPAARALRSAAVAAELGGDVAAALTAEAAGSAVAPVLRSLGACWTVCSASGSGLAAAVQRLEEGLRAQVAQRRAVDAELAGPRATAGLLAVLPAVGLALGAGLGADPLHVLLHTPLGAVCLVLGLGLDGLGVLWTGRLVARAAGAG